MINMAYEVTGLEKTVKEYYGGEYDYYFREGTYNFGKFETKDEVEEFLIDRGVTVSGEELESVQDTNSEREGKLFGVYDVVNEETNEYFNLEVRVEQKGYKDLEVNVYVR